MKYTIEMPKTIYLIFLISSFARKEKYYNTNDLIKLANELKPELVRIRKDKNDYKSFDDTNFGGLRGNFSTALTLRGFIKKNNKYTTYYGIGKTDRLFNAIKNGEIILDAQNYCAYTYSKDLKELLEKEIYNCAIRESQAHIKIYLDKNKEFPLSRDNINFPKVSVLKSKDNKYFLRILFNTFISENIVEFNMYNYLKGAKIKKFNMHALFVIPSNEDYWNEMYVIDSKEIITKTPLLMYFNKKDKKFYDNNGNTYNYFTLKDGLDKLSDQNGNIEERLSYNWNKTRKTLIENEVLGHKKVQQDEFSLFLEHFLKWKKTFDIYNKRVVDIVVSSSGGPDVILEFSGGTTQSVELEHKWINYILHRHHIDASWKKVWLYADEKWDFEKIKKIFLPYLSKYRDNIPKVFMSVNDLTGEKEVHEVNWYELTYTKVFIEN